MTRYCSRIPHSGRGSHSDQASLPEHLEELRRADDTKPLDLLENPQVLVSGDEIVGLGDDAMGDQEVVLSIPANLGIGIWQQGNVLGHTA